MKHLLDVNVLLAAVWRNHPLYARASVWLNGKTLVVCPITEIGFLRISTHRKAINAPMADARKALENFLNHNAVSQIAADLPGLESNAATSAVTDSYLADLAEKHGFKLATFDTGIKHRAVELIG
jgi:toxin-antitoxin system PIN domain toxin